MRTLRAIAIGVFAIMTSGCIELPDSGTLATGRPAPVDFNRPIELLLRRELPHDTNHVRFGATPYLSPDLMKRSYDPLTEYLSDSLGLQVELVLADSYSDLIEKVHAGSLDIFLISPLSYITAKEKTPNLKLLAQESASGMGSYSSYVVVREESRAQSLNDLIGKRLAFVDQHSTSGFLFPMAAFIGAGIQPGTRFKFCFSKSHAQAVYDLVAGKVDAATVSSNVVRFLTSVESENTKPLSSKIRILHKAGRIPYDALVARGEFTDSGLQKLKAAFANLNTRTERGRQALRKTAQITGWIPTSDETYDPVRQVSQIVNNHLKEHPIISEKSCDEIEEK
ncbi:MAG: phosphate/phosphite/phosphonate ABC transporter substrate-binding protein [Myxococcota bacterium]|nr:phosphate/phosphite/phosphonate ABC transporter substrate-binding protein [Myxococcota bacterium]